MKLGFVKEQNIPISIIILFAVAFLLVWLSPVEKTLGPYWMVLSPTSLVIS